MYPVCVSTLQTGLALYKYMDLNGEGQTQGHETCLLFHFAVDSASPSNLLLRHMQTMCGAH